MSFVASELSDGWILVRLYNRAAMISGMNTFEVLADRNRRRILEFLREEERPVGDVVRALGISQPGVSKHLRVLRGAGLVSVRPDARSRSAETGVGDCPRQSKRPLACASMVYTLPVSDVR